MAVIGLYDVDFFHGSKQLPNLELMKFFNYYHKRGDVVLFLRPQEDIGRCNRVIYFKDWVSTKVPKLLELVGDKKEIYGYGFYKKYYPFEEKISASPPNFLPYDINEDLIKNLKTYNHIKKNSIIRVETSDFSGFNPDASTIYIVDHEFFYLPNCFDFLKEYNTYKFEFYHQLRFTDENTFYAAGPYCEKIKRRRIVDWDYSKEFFIKESGPNVIFNANRRAAENVNDYVIRLIQLILVAKHTETNFLFTTPTFSAEQKKYTPIVTIIPDLTNWAYSTSTTSFFEYLSSKKRKNEIEDLVFNNSSIRLLLKQSPKTFTSRDVDF